MDDWVKHEKQVEHLNQLPLNQEAKRWLIEAKEDPDSTFQYLYQLLLWGLRPESLPEEYRLFLEKLAYQLDQEAAYHYLVKGLEFQDPEEFLLYPGDLERCGTPVEAAAKLLEAFKDAMTADPYLVPSFPPKTFPG